MFTFYTEELHNWALKRDRRKEYRHFEFTVGLVDYDPVLLDRIRCVIDDYWEERFGEYRTNGGATPPGTAETGETIDLSDVIDTHFSWQNKA